MEYRARDNTRENLPRPRHTLLGKAHQEDPVHLYDGSAQRETDRWHPGSLVAVLYMSHPQLDTVGKVVFDSSAPAALRKGW